jgi:hypothetical protein
LFFESAVFPLTFSWVPSLQREFANNRSAKVITLTDSVHSPMNLYSSCNLIADSDMASISMKKLSYFRSGGIAAYSSMDSELFAQIVLPSGFHIQGNVSLNGRTAQVISS